MNWFKKLIRMFFIVHGDDIPQAPKSKYEQHGITVEYFPLKQVYVARTQRTGTYASFCYLWTSWPTGNVDRCDIVHAKQFRNEEDAWGFADLWIEQKYKDNVKVIRR